MDSSLHMSASVRFCNWYNLFQGNFMHIGAEFGYRHDEVLEFINQFFLDLLEKRVDPESIRNPQAYLSTAFRRKLIDYHRQNSRKEWITLNPCQEYATVPSMQDTMERIENNQELMSTIRMAYEKLPDRCRRVIDLKFYRGMTTEQIVIHTGLSRRSVYNNLFEGIKLLRAEFKRIHPDDKIISLLVLLPCIFILI